MRPGMKILLGTTLIVPGLLFVNPSTRRSFGDEPKGIGRLFRFGSGGGSGSGSTSSANAGADPRSAPATPSPSIPYPTSSATLPYSSATPSVPSSTAPAPASSTAGQRLVPQPRVSKAVTEADPLVSRISLNRSDDGHQFGMFLQVFADGTVIDGEGTHHVGQDVLKPIVAALQAGDFGRLKGHCGGPSTDYVEQVHVVVFERSLGRLRANAFSYSGNPQGCDHAVRHLHTTLDALQTKISRPMPGPTAGATPSPSPATASSLTLTPSR